MAKNSRTLMPTKALAALCQSIKDAGGTLVELKVFGEPFGPALLGTSDTRWMFIGGVAVKVIPMTNSDSKALRSATMRAQ